MHDFDPRYCIRCRKQIPRELSENQGVCEDCQVALETLAAGSLGVPPRTDRPPPCPRCGSGDVEHEWVSAWPSRVLFAVGHAMRWVITLALWWSDWWVGGAGSSDSGSPDATLRYRCRVCRQHWKPA
jgi:hypothetical protein